MPSLTSNLNFVDRIANLGPNNGLFGISEVQLILEILIEMGFSGARFYEATLDVATNQIVLVLSATADKDKRTIGYKIPYTASTIGRFTSGTRPACARADSPNCTEAETCWISHLGLKEHQWIDLPISIAGTLHGLIACNWPLTEPSLLESDITVLSLVATSVAARLSFFAPRNGKAHPKQDDVRDINHFVQDAADEIARDIPAQAVAVFCYDPETDHLEKIYETFDSAIACKTNFEEIYDGDSTALTRLAWTEPRYRYVADFSTLAHNKPELIHQASHARHKAVLSQVTTVLYEVVTRNESRFLVRLINRSDAPQLPFSRHQQGILSSICRELSLRIDQEIAQRRLNSLRDIAIGAVSRIDDFDATVDLVRGALQREGIRTFFVFTLSDDSGVIEIESQRGTALSGWKPDSRIFTDNGFYADIVSSRTPVNHLLNDQKSASDPTGIFRHLVQKRAASITFFPFQHSTLKGALALVALSSRTPSSRGNRDLQRRLSHQQHVQIEAYSAVLCSCITARESFSTAENARQLVGHIGHEVNTPATIVSQKGLQALVLAERIVPTEMSDLRAQIAAVRATMETASIEMNRSMDIALLVAQENRGVLQVQLEKCDLLKVLKEARDALSSEMVVRGARGRTRRFKITFNEVCQNLGNVVCDGFLLKQLFINLLRNAMKYSLPRHDDEPMIVSINAMNQQGMVVFHVNNWGLGISPSEFEKIFRPFVRGTVHDRMKAIRGMGLGLYISRKIATVHRGSLVCHHSDFTLGDLTRREAWEGFETTFQFNLPKNLTEGVYEHRFKNAKHQP